jgi:hypothetical protein
MEVYYTQYNIITYIHTYYIHLHVSALTGPSSGLLTNQVGKCCVHVGIPACTQHLRIDDGPIRAETCNLIHNKYNVLDVNCFKIILV